MTSKKPPNKLFRLLGVFTQRYEKALQTVLTGIVQTDSVHGYTKFERYLKALN